MQYDFNTNSNIILGILPKIIPKLGELDHCIPGPNQNWAENSSEVRDAYDNYVDTMFSKLGSKDVRECWLCKWKNVTYPIFTQGNSVAYQSFFDNFPDIWAKVSKSQFFTTAIITFHNGKEIWNPASSISPETVDAEKDYLQKTTAALWKEYTDKISKLYGPQGLMQNETLTDADGNVSDNSAYLPMATTGLNMTRDLVQKAEDNDIAIKEYRDAIVQNNANIYKLKNIKDKINTIIDAAKSRREAQRKIDGLPPTKKICLDNERITYVINDEIK